MEVDERKSGGSEVGDRWGLGPVLLLCLNRKIKEQTKTKTAGMDHFWFFSWLESQSRPSYRPSPLVAQVAWMYQLR